MAANSAQSAQSTQKSQRRKVAPQPQRDKGAILVQWIFDEYEKFERGTLWYVMTFGIGGLLLIYAIRDGNFLFALMILLFALIIFTHHRNDPLKLSFTIYETGLQVGDKFYLFREIQSFAVIYEPPVVQRLYLVPRNAMVRREISIPLYEQNPVEIRRMLIDYIDEDLDREEESANDIAARVFKL